MENREVARILRETAQLLEIDGALIGRYRSYEKAAELIAGLPESVEQLAKEPEKLKELPGIGDRMVEHLNEILQTGDYARALLWSGHPTARYEEVERRVELRLRRQEILRRDDPVRLWAVIDACPLRRRSLVCWV